MVFEQEKSENENQGKMKTAGPMGRTCSQAVICGIIFLTNIVG
jgi:hypothetical protein